VNFIVTQASYLWLPDITLYNKYVFPVVKKQDFQKTQTNVLMLHTTLPATFFTMMRSRAATFCLTLLTQQVSSGFNNLVKNGDCVQLKLASKKNCSCSVTFLSGKKTYTSQFVAFG